MSDLTWTNERRRLSQLVPWERNPRQIRDAEAERLNASLEEFGQPEPFAVGPDGEVYNGHQRLQTWMERFGDIEVDVRVASRPLTEGEREKLTILLHVGTVGQFNWDALSGWDAQSLQDWGFGLETLQGWNRDANNLREMLNAEETVNLDDVREGMPEFVQENKEAWHQIIVNFVTAEDANRFAQLVGQVITDRTRSIWFPPQERADLRKVAFIES